MLNREINARIKLWHILIIITLASSVIVMYYLTGYTYDKSKYDTIKEIMTYNDLPNNRITIANLKGIVLVNGTNVNFAYMLNNQTNIIEFKYSKDLGVGSTESTLHIMTNPVKLPLEYSQIENLMDKSIHYILEDAYGNKIELEKVN